MARYLSWPAVSHICALIVFPSICGSEQELNDISDQATTMKHLIFFQGHPIISRETPQHWNKVKIERNLSSIWFTNLNQRFSLGNLAFVKLLHPTLSLTQRPPLTWPQECRAILLILAEGQEGVLLKMSTSNIEFTNMWKHFWLELNGMITDLLFGLPQTWFYEDS